MVQCGEPKKKLMPVCQSYSQVTGCKDSPNRRAQNFVVKIIIISFVTRMIVFHILHPFIINLITHMQHAELSLIVT